VAGVYGMNFSNDAGPWNMPELHWAYGYPAVIGVMVLIVIAMVLWFKKRGWF